MNPNDKLRELRRTLGLSQKDMGEKIGVSAASVAAFEGGACSFSRNASVKNKIMRFLTGEDEAQMQKLAERALEEERIRKAVQKTFTEGKCYRIYPSGNLGRYGGRENRSTMTGSAAWEYDCIFQFLRKDGIHHVFREIRGGWTRTYTDAQLIGKHIQEVNS